MKMKWIKCSEELPLAGKRVLITTTHGNVVEATRYKGCEFNRFGQKCTATHWMPLPQPPEE
ncbi:DUF551 domain-containing protein [Morganella morganii]